MALKDSVFSWFIQYIVEPKIEKMDSPGFIIAAISGQGKETYRRVLFLEEDLLSSIENKIVEKYGNNGKQILYSAGKKFGYGYASLSNFTQLENNNNKKFSDFIYFLTRLFATIYASAADYELNIEKKKFTISFKDYIVCSKNGLGYIMADGGVAGIFAYMAKDNSIEGVQIKCQGRGDDLCVIIAEPKNKLQSDNLKYFIAEDVEGFKFDETYKKYNLVRNTEHAQRSLKDLLDARFFDYDRGSIKYHGMRYIFVDSNLVYILENEIGKLTNGKKELFDACFGYGTYLQQKYGKNDYQKFITDYFSALGWGDVFTSSIRNKDAVAIFCYPWSIYSDKSEYIVIRGIISGFISSCTKREITFNKFDKKIENNSLTVVLTQ